MNVGPRGIRLNADKIDINGNREINLLIQNMRDKVDKTDIVNSLNLSREGLDINVNRIGIKGGDNNRYVQIQNDSIELGGIATYLERETFNRRYFYATERRSPKI
ncbi:phage minor structural protein [Staphylococcus aureus]|nr:phage minor structural protein [Staphylococcus aureus]